MRRFVEAETPSGVIFVEIENDDNDNSEFRLACSIDKISSFEDASNSLKNNAKYLLNLLKEMTPDEIEVSCGIKAGAEGGISFWALAKANAEASYTVKLKWKKDSAAISTHNSDIDDDINL